jgi:quinol monooxygenase YgiN
MAMTLGWSINQSGGEMMISLVVTVRAKEGREEDYARISGEFGRHIEANRKGCILFRTYRTDDPAEFITIEHFESEADLRAHQAHEETLASLDRLKDVLDGTLNIREFKQEQQV